MYQCLKFLLSLLYFITVCDSHLFLEYAESILQDEYFMNTLNLIEPRNLIGNYQNVKSDKFNVDCDRDLATFHAGLSRRELWALKMLDASSKIPPGLYHGNIIDLGMYDECIDINDESSTIKIRGRHCMYSINVQKGNASLPINPSLSICLPTTCTPQDIVDLVNNTLSAIYRPADLKMELHKINCARIDRELFDFKSIICISVISVIVGFLIVCTICDIFINDLLEDHTNGNTTIGKLAEFSLRKSAKSILKLESNDDSFPVIHGLKFISATWVILGHETMQQMFSVNANALYFVSQIHSWSKLLALCGQYSVDTFFTLSGFLMTYLFLKRISTHKKIHVSTLYIHRYLRVTPGIIIVIMCGLFLLPKLDSGPRWDSQISDHVITPCLNKWWSILLYIQNVVDTESMCFPYLWYVAADMQLFWISPLILYPLSQKPKLGLTILSGFLIFSLILSGLVIAMKQSPVASLFLHTDYAVVKDAFVNVYMSTYFHASPYFIGMFLGYDLFYHDRKMTKWMVVLGWFLTLSGVVFCCFGLSNFIKEDYIYDMILETTFAIITRPIWGLCISWIIYASVKGCAGPISSFLSWRIFVPLSRLSYSLYLVHMIVQLFTYANQRVPIYHSTYNVIFAAVNTVVLSTGLAFGFSLLFESPVIVLEKMLFVGDRGNEKQSTKNSAVKSNNKSGNINTKKID